MTNKNDKLSLRLKIGWAIGEFSVATYIGLTIAFLLFYSTQALGISPWLAGILLLLPRLWDAFTDPVMGAISDRTSSSMGRRRPYLLIGAILLGGSITALFSAPVDLSEFYKALYVLVFYFLASTAITIYDVPYSSMAAEMTTDYRERTILTGYKMIAARLGILIVLFGAPVIFGRAEDLATGFRIVGFVFGGFIMVTGVLSFFLTRGAPRSERPAQSFSLKSEFAAIRDNRPFRALWVVFLFQNLAIGASATILVYLLTMVVQVKPEWIGGFMAIAAVTATVATPIWVFLGAKVEKRTAYFMAIGISVIAPLPVLFLQPEAYALIFCILMFAGVGDAGNQLFPNAMVPDTVEVEELRTGERREGAIFGAWAFCRKLGMTAGAFLISLLLSSAGFVQGAEAIEQPKSAIFGIRIIYSLAPAALWACAALLLLRYELSEAKFNMLKKKIAAKTIEQN